jgi:hypothetical protein
MALWGKKKERDEHGEDAPTTNGEGSRRSAEHNEPTERTRLLQERPPPIQNDGYLDPDDPAVSCLWRLFESTQQLITIRSRHIIYGLSVFCDT